MSDAVKEINLQKFLGSMKLKTEVPSPVPMLKNNFAESTEEVTDEDRFLSSLAAVLYNIDAQSGKFDKGKIQDVVQKIDQIINAQINEIVHHEKFQKLEASWRSLYDLVSNTNFRANVMIDFLDVSKEELYEDFENNSVDITKGALFQKAYVQEYDQYGGKPFGGIIGLYDFEYTPADMFWLTQMGKVAGASYAPFIGNVSPKFFGAGNIKELAEIKDLEGMLNQPKFGAWNKLRDSEVAPYISLTLPRYILRLPYDPQANPCTDVVFKEDTRGDDDSKYLWGPSSILFARNMVRSFISSGWCQHIRGPKGGGLVSGLPTHTFNIRGEQEIKIPVEMVIPDYKELEYANSGFVPLVYRKGTADACFFSCQSLKKAKKFKDPKDTENAQLVTNLSYTMSVCRIAHYVKCIMRDNIGTTADAPYIQNSLTNWISKYITTIVNPDDFTLRYYPFKAAVVEVVEQEGAIGWYKCNIAVKPHIQFEGMDVELRLESRL